jgi:putative endonuclease
MKNYYVYILTNKENTVLYIGVTSDIKKRVWQHKNSVFEGFTSQYKTFFLVYYEQTNSIESALTREKSLKNWHRGWKINLISNFNPTWRDLYGEI